MNIIGNTCLGSSFMKFALNSKLNNPFSWALIDNESMLYLIKNYDKIDFKNIQIGRLSDSEATKKYLPKLRICQDLDYYILIDGKVMVCYMHIISSYMKQSKVYESRREKIIPFLRNIYFRRLARMKEEPIFVIGTSWERCVITESYINELLKLKSKYKIIMVGKLDYNKKLPSNYIYVKSTVSKNDAKCAKSVYNEICNKLVPSKPKVNVVKTESPLKLELKLNKLQKPKLLDLPVPFLNVLKLR